MRDEFRMDYDEDRGGFGGRAAVQKLPEGRRNVEIQEDEPMQLS